DIHAEFGAEDARCQGLPGTACPGEEGFDPRRGGASERGAEVVKNPLAVPATELKLTQLGGGTLPDHELPPRAGRFQPGSQGLDLVTVEGAARLAEVAQVDSVAPIERGVGHGRPARLLDEAAWQAGV